MPENPDKLFRRSLSGAWLFRRESVQEWVPIRVPGCWETQGEDKEFPGPYFYKTTFEIPDKLLGTRLWLHFGGVSYHSQFKVNNENIGEHTGTWDEFDLEITAAVHWDRPNELLVRVEKPASLTKGPYSTPVEGNFPMQETLSGFLPYVWGHAFGGIWQDVELYSTGDNSIKDVSILGAHTGEVRLAAQLDIPGEVHLSIDDPDGKTVWKWQGSQSDRFELSLQVPHPHPWSQRQPDLYTALLMLYQDSALQDQRILRFGLRSLNVQGTNLSLNNEPLYPRLILSWGWYPDLICPNPDLERIRADFKKLKSLGFNGVKTCLWIPPRRYLDLADELGMLIWIELPLWMPVDTPFFRRQTPLEYSRLIRQVRNHPAIILYTLGCELDKHIDQTLLEHLYIQAKIHLSQQDLLEDSESILDYRSSLSNTPALVRDNSGSAEAYGGWLDEQADFYDHHFYSELQYLDLLFDHFAPRWRSQKPWFMGEYCDFDTLRDLAALGESGSLPSWWASPDPKVNPRGARWEMRLPTILDKLRQNGLWERRAEIKDQSYKQALFHRKASIEKTRARNDICGYVVTGEADTPVSSAGMWDDAGQLKFDPQEFRSFNQDSVLCLGCDRKRAWVAGGDRPEYEDTYNFLSGSTFRAHLILSHYGSQAGPAAIEWEIGFPGRLTFCQHHLDDAIDLIPGTITELAVCQFVVPELTIPCQAILKARLIFSDEIIENSWTFWFYPKTLWSSLQPFRLWDPLSILAGLPQLIPQLCLPFGDDAPVFLATRWSDQVDQWLKQGKRGILLLQKDNPTSPVPIVELPYWREAIKVTEPHPSWGDFPHQFDPGLQFYGCAPDCALDTARIKQAFTPIFRRLDARGMNVHDYALEIGWGKGKLLVSTLRFQGGLGDQPSGINRNIGALYLLTRWITYLQGNQST